jgi:hypothetical protein
VAETLGKCAFHSHSGVDWAFVKQVDFAPPLAAFRVEGITDGDSTAWQATAMTGTEFEKRTAVSKGQGCAFDREETPRIAGPMPTRETTTTDFDRYS